MTRRFHEYRSALIALACLGLLGAASLTVVNEDEQAVIKRAGEPERVVNRFRPAGESRAGIIAHIPLLETVTRFPRSLVTYRHEAKRVKTADQQWLLVDTDVTYRIVDPVRLASSLATLARAEEQIQTLLPALIDQELGQRDAGAIIRPGAGNANTELLGALDGRMRQYGVQVVDLRLARIGLDEESQFAAFDRMRQRHEAKLGEIEVASANDALAITAAAEAEATARRKRSADQDPEFYSFFRAMRSYDEMYGDPKRKNSTTIVLPPDSGYLKYFGGK